MESLLSPWRKMIWFLRKKNGFWWRATSSGRMKWTELGVMAAPQNAIYAHGGTRAVSSIWVTGCWWSETQVTRAERNVRATLRRAKRVTATLSAIAGILTGDGR